MIAPTVKAQNRDKLADKVATKIRGENERMHEVHELEREKRTCRREIDRLEFELHTKEMNVGLQQNTRSGLVAQELIELLFRRSEAELFNYQASPTSS